MKRLVGRSGVGLFEIVAEPLVVVLGANVEFGLDGTGLANNLGCEVMVFEFERRLVLREVVGGLWTARFKQSDFQSSLGQPLAGPTARGARAHYQYIERLIFCVAH